jgi:small ligand-binding sensory domain FIST
MSARIGAGICGDDAGPDAFAQAAGRAALELRGAPADLALVFAGAETLEHAGAGMEAVRERLGAGAIVGCGAQGVLGSGRELEEGGVAVWSAALGDAQAEPFHVHTAPTSDGLTLEGLPDLDGADAMLLLADPYTFPVEALLAELGRVRPGMPVLGGIASAGPGPDTLLYDGERAGGGAVGVLLRGADVRACVSQGACPVGPEMAVTAAEGSEIHELASEPALERLQRAIGELEPAEQAMAGGGILLGIVIDPNKPDYERGDFLTRGIVGVDEQTGSLTVGARVAVGQTVRLQVRDAASAHEDLALALDRQLADLDGPPAGALVFTCNGRGSRMFGTPDHDAQAVAEAFSGAPTGGFFCAGEIGPVGDRNFVHGFTATLAVFAS